MPKTSTIYVCRQCGATSVKWRGKCPACGEWNTYTEEIVEKSTASGQSQSATSKNVEAEQLDSFDLNRVERTITPDDELNRVLGGGIVPGSLILIGGEPGIGKSTLLLQLALIQTQKPMLYISGEESLNQIKIRASRIGEPNPQCYLLPETSIEQIEQQIKALEPGILIVDSIQTLTTAEIDSTAGSIPQIRECTNRLQKFAKMQDIAVFLVGHITKEGFIAGPKVLEHMVDTVLYFEGDRNYNYRILRTIKNRFGSISEIGIYEMTGEGLRQVKNPSELLLSQREEALSGTSIAAMMEGVRPMLIEIQALVSPAYYGTPQRSSTGLDSRRMSMLVAVLEKRCGIPLNSQDIFLNVAGGLKIEDPSTDLAMAVAIVSSYEDQPVGDNVCFAGEIGLSGELRPVQQINQRIAEAEKLGFQKIFISSYNRKVEAPNDANIEIVMASTLNEMLQQLMP